MNLICIHKIRESDCFCTNYDENRQTMFYCGFFTTLAGFIWFVIGFSLKCAFFTQAFGPSVNAVACGIMVVGIMVLILGVCSTLSVVCTSKANNKTGCVSASSTKCKLRSGHEHKKDRIYFNSPLEKDIRINSHRSLANRSSPFQSGSFSSAELNLSSSSSSNVYSSSSSSSGSEESYKSNIAMIA